MDQEEIARPDNENLSSRQRSLTRIRTQVPRNECVCEPVQWLHRTCTSHETRGKAPTTCLNLPLYTIGNMPTFRSHMVQTFPSRLKHPLFLTLPPMVLVPTAKTRNSHSIHSRSAPLPPALPRLVLHHRTALGPHAIAKPTTAGVSQLLAKRALTCCFSSQRHLPRQIQVSELEWHPLQHLHLITLRFHHR